MEPLVVSSRVGPSMNIALTVPVFFFACHALIAKARLLLSKYAPSPKRVTGVLLTSILSGTVPSSKYEGVLFLICSGMAELAKYLVVVSTPVSARPPNILLIVPVPR